MRKIVFASFPFIALSTIICGVLYVSVQQSIRMSANDPQIQIAEDSAALLMNGVSSDAVVGSSRVSLDQSLAVFVSVFDEQGKLVRSSARLASSPPVPPSGVFTYARQHGENRLTWEPAPGVRSAVVITHYVGMHGGFVMVGRSLREVEVREHQLLLFAFVAWLLSILAILLAITGILRKIDF